MYITGKITKSRKQYEINPMYISGEIMIMKEMIAEEWVNKSCKL
jgi:hypothetical protein